MHAESVCHSSAAAPHVTSAVIPPRTASVAHRIASVAILIRLAVIVESVAVVGPVSPTEGAVIPHATTTTIACNRPAGQRCAHSRGGTTERTISIVSTTAPGSETAHSHTVHAAVSSAHSHRAGRTEGTASDSSSSPAVEPISGHGKVVGVIVVGAVSAAVSVARVETAAHSGAYVIVAVRIVLVLAAVVIAAVVVLVEVVVARATLPRSIVASVI